MRHHRPDAPELLGAVAGYLSSLKERLDEGDRYQVIVCEHILGLVVRELEAPPLSDMDEAALAAEIRSGARDADWDVAFDEVLRRTIARLAIVRPEHLAAEHQA